MLATCGRSYLAWLTWLSDDVHEVKSLAVFICVLVPARVWGHLIGNICRVQL